MRQLFLDCDGVLADFDSSAKDVFGMNPRQAEAALGSDEFWKRLRGSGEFYLDLPVMPDAMELFNAVAHLKPIILTGCPAGGWSEDQKIGWAQRHFPGVPVITCRSKDKFMHMMQPGDVLVDDFLKYKELWEQAGGVFVRHVSARDSIERLVALGFDLVLPEWCK